MEFAAIIGELELRAARKGRRRLRGRFPYRKRAVLSDGGRKGGRPQKEEFMPGAFSHSINNAEQDQHLLVGHSFDAPLASKNTGTLTFDDTKEALTFDAEISEAIADTSYGSDILKQIDSGLSVGISPGFRIPPPRAVAKPEVFTDEGHDPARGMHNARIRTIFAAILFELSVVTRPAYKDATIEPVFDDLGNLTNADELTDEQKLALGWTLQNGILIPPEATIEPVFDALGNLTNADELSDDQKLALGWTLNAAGVLVPPKEIIKRAMPAALRWR